ncbi:glycosyltransferase [Algoriphagus confluentis]|uniref:Glycosyltransferase n=1 Tax=Algoriphagus confluentis TaxID=1697556 RepID=A0ABQ6PK88_9BACT|nr:glycosyltransferase [Algoriphagus confluentis]
MAKILLSVGIVEGHTFPVLPLAKGLVALGHEVHWVGSRIFQEKIENTGAVFHPYPESLDYPSKGLTTYQQRPALVKKKGLDQIKEYLRWFFDEEEGTHDCFRSLTNDVQPDIFIGDPVNFSPLFLGEILGKPTINLHVIPPLILSQDTAPFGSGLLPAKSPLMRIRNRFLNYLIDRVLFKDVTAYGNKLREKRGLPLYQGFFGDFNKYVDRVLIFSVPGFDYERSDMPDNHQFIGPPLPKPDPNWEEPDWWGDLKKAKKVVLVNQGTIANDIQDLIMPTLIALKDEPDTLVVAVPVKEEIPNLPGNARVAPFIPFAHLLPHVDLLVTNGGYGGTNMALGFGIPIVIGGATEDKMEVAQRVTVSGTGIDMKTMKPKPEKLKAAIHEVLSNPKYKQNALRLKHEIESYDSVALVDQAIQELLEKYGKKNKVLV